MIKSNVETNSSDLLQILGAKTKGNVVNSEQIAKQEVPQELLEMLGQSKSQTVDDQVNFEQVMQGLKENSQEQKDVLTVEEKNSKLPISKDSNNKMISDQQAIQTDSDPLLKVFDSTEGRENKITNSSVLKKDQNSELAKLMGKRPDPVTLKNLDSRQLDLAQTLKSKKMTTRATGEIKTEQPILKLSDLAQLPTQNSEVTRQAQLGNQQAMNDLLIHNKKSKFAEGLKPSFAKNSSIVPNKLLSGREVNDLPVVAKVQTQNVNLSPQMAPARNFSNVHHMLLGQEVDQLEKFANHQPGETAVSAAMVTGVTSQASQDNGLSVSSQQFLQIDTNNPEALIGKIQDYIIQHQVDSQKEVNVRFAHDELGVMDLKVEKGADKSIAIQLETANQSAHQLLKSHQSEMLQNLTKAGVVVGEMKVELSSSSDSQTKFAQNDHQSQSHHDQTKQFANQHNRQDGQRRRDELWQMAKERMNS